MLYKIAYDRCFKKIRKGKTEGRKIFRPRAEGPVDECFQRMPAANVFDDIIFKICLMQFAQ